MLPSPQLHGRRGRFTPRLTGTSPAALLGIQRGLPVEFDRAKAIDARFKRFLLEEAGTLPRLPAVEGSRLSADTLLELYDAQVTSRHVDFAARALRARDRGYYTIGSAGHEGNAVLGELLRVDDPCFLHYRSGAFMVQRGRKDPTEDVVRTTLLGICAAASDPLCEGRHKVWGSRPLWVAPQTSTIASQLPKVVGAALAIDRGHRLGVPVGVPIDAIVCCSFGDASVNHSTAQGAFNAASWLSHQKIPVPLLLVCEDNGWGISVPTPPGWVQGSFRDRLGFAYYEADGTDLPQAYEAAAEAIARCRRDRCPTFLRLSTVRLMGHAGSDIESEYRQFSEIETSELRDPLILGARRILAAGLRTPGQLLDHYEGTRARVMAVADEVANEPQLDTVAKVVAALAPNSPAAVQREATRPAAPSAELAEAGKRAIGRQRHMAAMINRALHEAMAKYPGALVFGEDVARKGGVYHVTTGLWKAFGPGRVFNTLLDEQAILGLAIGAAHLGFLPIPEIQYLAYLHNALDQIRGEACSLQFFSNDQFRNPMVVRIASFAYQKGFGGHFHNDNALGALREIPGLVVAAPARGDEAVGMLRTCLAMAQVDGRVVAFLEPIALYMTKDLHADGDGAWLSDYPEPDYAVPLGEGRVYHPEAGDLTIVSYANGLWRSLRAAMTLREEHGISARVLDLRWLQPLNTDWIVEHARATGRLLVVDECRRAGALGESVLAGVALAAPGTRMELVAGVDCYIPLGPPMQLMLPQEADVVAAAQRLMVG
ncbi:MAG: MFS transporter [Planctomycetes bacterium]|nr:MFS transporter [Planctomycetota bacterium]